MADRQVPSQLTTYITSRNRSRGQLRRVGNQRWARSGRATAPTAAAGHLCGLRRYYLPRVATLRVLLLLATACSKTDSPTPTVDTSNDNSALGNPSGAMASTTSPTNYLLTKPQYVVGYNRDQGKPTWVPATWAALRGKMTSGPIPTCPAAGTR